MNKNDFTQEELVLLRNLMAVYPYPKRGNTALVDSIYKKLVNK